MSNDLLTKTRVTLDARLQQLTDQLNRRGWKRGMPLTADELDAITECESLDARVGAFERRAQADADVAALSARINSFSTRRSHGRMGFRLDCPNPAGALSPLQFSEQQLRSLHRKALAQEPAWAQPERRDFESAVGLLPAQLYPVPTFPIHEKRLLNYLPGFALDAPSLEYIQVNSVTGAAAVVPQGTPKPEIVMNTSNVIATAQKIAAHTGISWESINDWSAFTASVNTELMRQVVDVENAFLLGTGTYTQGLLQQSGILTHDYASDPDTVTPLDAFEISIAQLRVGPSLAEPDIIVVNPATWSAVRRTKDSMNRYLVTPDPAADEPETIWGTPILTTTTCTEGTAVLIDSTKFGRVAVREALSMRIGYGYVDGQDDFTSNILRYICEERLILAVERPSAVLSLTGLPAS